MFLELLFLITPNVYKQMGEQIKQGNFLVNNMDELQYNIGWKKSNTRVYTLGLHFYDVQEQANPVYGDRSQNSSYA